MFGAACLANCSSDADCLAGLTAFTETRAPCASYALAVDEVVASSEPPWRAWQVRPYCGRRSPNDHPQLIHPSPRGRDHERFETVHRGDPGCRTVDSITPAAEFANNIDPLVQEAILKGLYVIVDLHFISDYGSQHGAIPQSTVLNFWNYVAPRYANVPNVIFEVFNEPVNPVNWASWTSYIQPVVNAIRAVAPNNLILMGSPSWSTMVNSAVTNPIAGGNIVYVYHIYPSQGTPTTSLLDSKFGTAANSIPTIITEFGWQPGGGNVVNGTTSGWGIPFKTYIDAHPQISWSAVIFSDYWKPIMFDHNWKLLGGDYEGQTIKDWLAEKQNDHQPQ
jgi:endoglucanase